MKKPEEIKLGLDCGDCKICPYSEYRNNDGDYHCNEVEGDALAYIQQLESKLNQAVEDIRLLGRTGEFICPVCAHYNHGEGTKGECIKCLTGDGFRWRGDKEEDNAQ